MPRITQISDEARPPLFPKMECMATVESIRYDATGRSPVLFIGFRLISDQYVKDENGEDYPVNGRLIVQRYYVTPAALWRIEPLLIATETPYTKIPLDIPKQFKYDFETDPMLGKHVIVPVTVESYVAKNVKPDQCTCDPKKDTDHDENRVVNNIGKDILPANA